MAGHVSHSYLDLPYCNMESVFVVYADGSIVEADLHSGAVVRQVQSFQGAFHLSAAQVATWPSSTNSVASSLSSSTAIVLQNKNSSKAHFWSCFEGGASFEIRTPTVKFGGSGKVTSIASSACGRYLLRGLQSGAILITELSPPSTQSIRAKNATADGGSSKMAPIEVAQQGGASSFYWSHNLVQTSHLGAITSLSCNENGMVAIASEDQAVSVVHLAALLASIPSQTSLAAQLSASTRSSSTVDSYAVPTARLHEHTQGIVQLKLSRDGRVFSISKDHTLKISDAVSETRIASISFPSALTCFAVSPNEETVYVGAQDGNVYKLNLWDISSKPSHSDSTSNAFASSTSAFGANYDWSSTITSTLAEWASAEADQAIDTSALAFATVNTKRGLGAGDIEPNAYRGHTQPISSISLSLDCSRIVTSAMDGTLLIWDERTCQVIHRVNPIKGVGVAWSHLVCRPSSTSTISASKFRLDASSKEKSSIPFALVQKSQTSVGSAYGSISVPLGECRPSSSQHPNSTSSISSHPASFLHINVGQCIQDLSDTVTTAQDDMFQLGLDVAERLKESHSSEVENLKEEVARLTAMNEKWKQVNNSLFSSSLSSTLK